jgi:hypothetical protein
MTKVEAQFSRQLYLPNLVADWIAHHRLPRGRTTKVHHHHSPTLQLHARAKPKYARTITEIHHPKTPMSPRWRGKGGGGGSGIGFWGYGYPVLPG